MLISINIFVNSLQKIDIHDHDKAKGFSIKSSFIIILYFLIKGQLKMIVSESLKKLSIKTVDNILYRWLLMVYFVRMFAG